MRFGGGARCALHCLILEFGSLRVPRGVVVLHTDLTEQILAGRQQPHLGAALVQLEPAPLDGVPHASTELAAFASSVNRNGA
jgi:hypothetical protein